MKHIVLGFAAVLWITCSVASAQTPTTINLSSQARNADFSGFSFTRPTSIGSVLPSTCKVGQLFFNTAAPPGASVFGCSQQNTWSVVGGYALPPAGSNTLGGVSIPNNSGLTLSSNGILSVNIGTGAGTVAAGNDARIVNALQPGSLIPAGNVTGLARSATTDATNASNISAGTLSTALFPTTISSNTTGNAATATAFAATPVGCSASQYMTGISARGAAICAQVGYSQVSATPALYNQMLQAGGTGLTPRANLNFAAGPNVTITPSDNGTNTTTLTFSAGSALYGVNASAPINSSGGTNPTISCPTCAIGSAPFTNYTLLLGQGGQAITSLGSTGSTTQVLHGNASGVPSWSAVNLATDVTGKLSSTSITGLAASATTDTTNAANISSGTLTPARLPTPGASTLGGIESSLAQPHQWINSISIAGVAGSSQPAFTDIAGSLTASQLPSLTGDTTTSAGSTVTTTVRVNGTSVPANTASDQTIITMAAATGSWASLPYCPDTGGNHLNYNTSTHAFSCGNTGGAGGNSGFGSISSGTNNAAAMLVGTGASLAPAGSGTVTANGYSGILPAASLPPPTPSTLGGVTAYTAPSHQWINAVPTTGVPSSSQPAASDIMGLASSATTDTTNASNISSGILSASRLPVSIVQNNQVNTYSNQPSPPTPGTGSVSIWTDSIDKNVEAKNETGTKVVMVQPTAAAAHQFISGISSAGAVSQIQPAFSDISGTIAGGQLPGNVPTSITSDINVTGSVAGNVLTLGWAGALAKNRLLSTTVFTDQTNTYTPGMKQTFSASAVMAGEGFAGVTVDPSTLASGDRWFRTDTKRVRVYDGSTAQTIAWLSDVAPSIMTFDAFFPMGSCPASATPALAWDAPVSGTGAIAAGCSGTNINQAYAGFANSGTPALLRTFTLPPSFVATNGADIYISYLTQTGGGTFTLALDMVCTASNGTATNDPTWTPNNFLVTGSQTAPGTPNQVQMISITGVPWPTGCTANSLAHMRLIRTDTTGSAASVLVTGVTLVGRRTL